MRWAVHVASMGEMRNSYKILVRKSEASNHAEDLGAYRNIILELILGKYGGKLWTGCNWLRIGINIFENYIN